MMLSPPCPRCAFEPIKLNALQRNLHLGHDNTLALFWTYCFKAVGVNYRGFSFWEVSTTGGGGVSFTPKGGGVREWAFYSYGCSTKKPKGLFPPRLGRFFHHVVFLLYPPPLRAGTC